MQTSIQAQRLLGQDTTVSQWRQEPKARTRRQPGRAGGFPVSDRLSVDSRVHYHITQPLGPSPSEVFECCPPDLFPPSNRALSGRPLAALLGLCSCQWDVTAAAWGLSKEPGWWHHPPGLPTSKSPDVTFLILPLFWPCWKEEQGLFGT